MKSSSYYASVLLFIFIFLSTIAFAQEGEQYVRFSFFGGAVLPQGDFGSTSGEKAGYATTGFSGTIEGRNLLNQSVNWVTSLTFAFNSLDESTMESQMGGGTITASNYATTWAMTGIGFESEASPTLKIYGVGQVGLLLSSFPDITFSYGGSSIKQTAALGSAFAIGFGAGIMVNKLNIGLRYYTGEPEYEQTATYGGLTGKAKVKMPATILQLMVGFNI